MVKRRPPLLLGPALFHDHARELLHARRQGALLRELARVRGVVGVEDDRVREGFLDRRLDQVIGKHRRRNQDAFSGELLRRDPDGVERFYRQLFRDRGLGGFDLG